MITELFEDLISKLSAIPDLQGRVGAQVGGTDTDTTMMEAPVPFAWVLFANNLPQTNEANNGKNYLISSNNFIVLLVIKYSSEMTDDDFLHTHMKLIDECVTTVHSSSELNYAGLWQYTGCDLHSVFPDRLVYQLGFSANGHQQIN